MARGKDTVRASGEGAAAWRAAGVHTPIGGAFLGGRQGYAATNWYAVVVSSKTPSGIVATLNTILTKALVAPEVRAAYAQQGMETLAGTAVEAASHIARETEIWKKVIADAGMRLQ
jgi:tripartite-type tricarboxylate transporter receptor subunit TctC